VAELNLLEGRGAGAEAQLGLADEGAAIVFYSTDYDELIGMFNRTGRFNPEALAVLSRSFVEMGMLAQEPDIKTLITEEYLPGAK